MATVTALRSAGRSRAAVELDGHPWRTLPLEAVVAAGLAAGVELDRPRARRLAQELRRLRALQTATAALRRRDRSRHELEERLRHRRVAPVEREQALAVLERAGLVEDGRFARERARVLAARGAGDALIRDDLERRGVSADAAEQAVGSLAPELARAEQVVARRGGGPRTARYLTARGFDSETVELVIARGDGSALG